MGLTPADVRFMHTTCVVLLITLAALFLFWLLKYRHGTHAFQMRCWAWSSVIAAVLLLGLSATLMGISASCRSWFGMLWAAILTYSVTRDLIRNIREVRKKRGNDDHL